MRPTPHKSAAPKSERGANFYIPEIEAFAAFPMNFRQILPLFQAKIGYFCRFSKIYWRRRRGKVRRRWREGGLLDGGGDVVDGEGAADDDDAEFRALVGNDYEFIVFADSLIHDRGSLAVVVDTHKVLISGSGK